MESSTRAVEPTAASTSKQTNNQPNEKTMDIDKIIDELIAYTQSQGIAHKVDLAVACQWIQQRQTRLKDVSPSEAVEHYFYFNKF